MGSFGSDWLEKALYFFESSHAKSWFLKVFDRAVQMVMVAFALLLMFLPARDLYLYHQKERVPSPEQIKDYESLMQRPNDQAVTEAAHELLKRPDVTGVHVIKGDVQSPEFEITLNEEGQGDIAFAPPFSHGGYSSWIVYKAFGARRDFWDLAAPIQGIACFTMGLFLLAAGLTIKRGLEEEKVPSTEINPSRPSPPDLRAVK